MLFANKIYILRSLTPKKCFKMYVYVPCPWKFGGPKLAQKIMHRFYSNLQYLNPVFQTGIDQQHVFWNIKINPDLGKNMFFFILINIFLNSEFEITMSAFQWTFSYFKNDENRFGGWGWIAFEKKVFLSTLFVPNAARPDLNGFGRLLSNAVRKVEASAHLPSCTPYIWQWCPKNHSCKPFCVNFSKTGCIRNISIGIEGENCHIPINMLL